MLLKACEDKNKDASAFRPFMYLLCHAYECYLKTVRVLNGIVGKEKSHNLIDLSKELNGLINEGVFQYAIWLSNHHYLKHDGGTSYPDRYDDYQFDSKKTIDLWTKVKKQQVVLGLDSIDALGPFNQKLNEGLGPDYSSLRKMVANSVRIIPKDFNDCIKILKDELNKLEI